MGSAESIADAVAPAVATTLSEALAAVLVDVGIRHAFCVLGGAVAPFSHAVDRSAIELIHCRHESGAAFAAAEAYFTSGRPGMVLTVGGPGLTNALTGAVAAKWEGAKLVLISGATSAARRGRWAFQETSAYTLAALEPSATGSLFDFAASLDDPSQLAGIAARLEAGFARPQGFVAHIALPIDAQTRAAPAAPLRRRREIMPPSCPLEVAQRCARLLRSAPFGIWVGFGARHAAPQIRALAERCNAAVMCTPRAKGVFPERHPRFVGVTGFAGHDSVRAYLAAERPARLLVLGSRLGEFSSFWDPELVPPHGLVHVDLDATVPGTAYPDADVDVVECEIGAFLDGVLAQLPPVADVPHLVHTRAEPRRAEPSRSAVSARAVMDAVQRIVIDGADGLVMTEAGNAFAWGNHTLQFARPGRYRVSMGFGSMGQAVAGVIGAALGRSGKAVAIVGDGAMLMNSEVSTAVQYGIGAVWIVLNDARYGMVEQGLSALRLSVSNAATSIPRCDFAAIARAMGASGVRVEHAHQLDEALEAAMASAGPFVIDVLVDPGERAPSMARFRSLAEQWSNTQEDVT